MTVLSCREQWESRGRELGAPDALKATRRWLATTDSRADREVDVVNYGIGAAILPERFSPHPDNLFLTCRSLRVRQRSESPLAWDIEAEYSSEPLKKEEKDKEENPNPLDRPAKIRWTSVRYQKPCIQDINGDAVVNAVGDYPDPPPEIDTSRWAATVQKNLAAVPTWLLSFQDAVNSEAFTISGLDIPKGCAKLMQMEISEQQEEHGVNFYVLTLTIEILPEHEDGEDAWDLRFLNQGFRQIDSNASNPTYQKPIEILTKDKDGKDHRPTAPMQLDEDGIVIESPTPSNVHFMRYEVYPKMDFAELPLT